MVAATILCTGLGASACRDNVGPKKIAATAVQLEGRGVVLDVRAAEMRSDAVIFEAVVGNNEDHALVAMHVDVTLKRSDGSVLQTLDLTPIGGRAKITVLEPNYEVPIHEQIATKEAPASIEAKVRSAEAFKGDAEAPELLETTSEGKADASRVEFASLGHFRFDTFEETGDRPFRATLGLRNTGKTAIREIEYGLAFEDEKGREVDRAPLKRKFEPPLLPGDAVLENVQANVRAFDRIRVVLRRIDGE